MLLPLLLISSCFSGDEQNQPSAPLFQQAHASAPPPMNDPNEYDLPCCIAWSCFCDCNRSTQFSLRQSTRENNRLLNAAVQAMRIHEQGRGIDSCALCDSRDDLEEHYCRAQKMPAGRLDSDHPKICNKCKNNHCLCPVCAGPKFRKMLASPAQQTMPGEENAQPPLPEDLAPIAKYCCKPIAQCCGQSCACLGVCVVEAGNCGIRFIEWSPYCSWQPINGCCLMLGTCGDWIGKECSGCSVVWNNECTKACRSVCRRMRRRCFNDAREIENAPAEDPSRAREIESTLAEYPSVNGAAL